MDLYGVLNKTKIKKEYVGINTDTAQIDVNNNCDYISLNVKKVPKTLNITIDKEKKTFDGSEELDLELPSSTELDNEIKSRIEEDSRLEGEIQGKASQSDLSTLSSQVQNAVSQVDNLDSQVGSLNSQIESLNSNVAQANTKIEENTTSITNLQNEIGQINDLLTNIDSGRGV